jgi:uncharacterized protein (DUF2267 family)
MIGSGIAWQARAAAIAAFDANQGPAREGRVQFSTIDRGGNSMSAFGLESLEHTVQLTHIWINELDERLGWNNKPRTYRLLKAVLHALRDWLPLNEMADFGAQLPELLRGAYYEQWRPAITPVKKRSKEDFLARVDRSFKQDPLPQTAQAVMAAFELLSRKVTAGEIEDVRHSLPEELRNLWPEPYKAPGAVRR